MLFQLFCKVCTKKCFSYQKVTEQSNSIKITAQLLHRRLFSLSVKYDTHKYIILLQNPY